MPVTKTNLNWLRPAVFALAWTAFTVAAFAQATPDQTLGGALRTLTLRANTIVTGRVANIERTGDIVTITLAVEDTLKGAAAPTFTFREWAGLWPLGQSRYELGQRATFFLHANSTSGLASPVDGSDGVVPVEQQSADQPAVLDVRRLAARLERPIGAPMLAEEQSAITLADAKSLIAHAADPTPREPIRFPLPIGIIRKPTSIVLQRTLSTADAAQ